LEKRGKREQEGKGTLLPAATKRGRPTAVFLDRFQKEDGRVPGRKKKEKREKNVTRFRHAGMERGQCLVR